MKSYMVFLLAHLHLTLAHSLGQCQGHPHILTANISKMVRDKANITIVIKYEVAYGVSIK